MSFASRKYQEKRNFIRMKVDASVVIKTSASHNDIAGHCHDLSGGGMLVELPRAIPVGTEVEVAIESSHGHNPMLKARAQVSRVNTKPCVGNVSCLTGLEILEMIE